MATTFYQLWHSARSTFGPGIARVRGYAGKHKVLTAVVAIVVLGGAWYAYGAATSTAGETRYYFGTVARGTIVSAVTGSGQITANQTLSLTPQVSGQVTYVGVTPGEKVAAGTLIAEIDPTDALKTVRDAQTSLESAQLSLQKTEQSANAVESSRTDLVNLYLDLPDVVTGLENIADRLSGNQFLPNNIGTHGGEAYRQQALSDNTAAQSAYTVALAAYQNADVPDADASQLAALLANAQKAVTLAQTAVGSANIFLTWYQNSALTPGAPVPASVTSDLATLSSDASKLSSHNSALLSDTNSLSTEPLDQASSELSVTQAKNALQDAENTLAKYYIRAPFDGTIGAVNVHTYDQAGSGAVATLITAKQIADLSVNEVDAAKIAVGDKATLTFDAIPGLTLTGTVAILNPVGTVTQGVVSYDVQISLDAQDARVKTGMSVNASIESAVHEGALFVPSGAVKTTNGQSYVLAFVPPLATTTADATGGVVTAAAPARVPVAVGISDDLNTEILSGLSEGQQIVVRSAAGAGAAAAAAPATRTGGATGGNRGFGGGGAVRIGG
ncbi:efflux RND transporter periplasmic adaptor subunit [Patescibacteria group bacterium]|nr:efflux RND transporter periplasmic adaptor subunit [Patescibacteria group bacterium]